MQASKTFSEILTLNILNRNNFLFIYPPNRQMADRLWTIYV